IAVHRFRLDPHDRARHLESVQAILEANGPVSDEAERAYLDHSIRSAALVVALRQRIDDFDAVVVGPYLFALTHQVAQACAGKTLLLPCFHDEPFARLRAWLDNYAQVGGILYHSPEEQDFAQRDLGLNHPGAVDLGTLLDNAPLGDAAAGRSLAADGR